MAATAGVEDNTAKTTQWGSVVTGQLGEDFLRIEGAQGGDVMTINPALYNSMFAAYQQGGVLTITVVQARLAKNYGMTRMDPYCRLRVGMQVFETPTSYNGSKTPRWNKLIQCQIPETLREIYVEVFDECSFSIDERIAWGSVPLGDAVFAGDTAENWHSLSGKQGEEKEGMIHIVFKYQKLDPAAARAGMPVMQNPMMVMGAQPMVVNPPPLYGYTSYTPPTILTQQAAHPVLPPPPPQSQQNGPPAAAAVQISAEDNARDIKTLKEMCPEMDDDIIQSVLQQCGGNIDRAAEQLLEMSAS